MAERSSDRGRRRSLAALLGFATAPQPDAVALAPWDNEGGGIARDRNHRADLGCGTPPLFAEAEEPRR